MYTLCTSKCASNHNTVHFFNMSTSKCAPSMWCFYHADLDICFVPQRRAMFHLWYRYLRSHKSLGQIVSRSSYLFEHLHLLSSDFLLLRSYPPLIFSLLTSFMSLLFHLSMLSEVRLLTFIFLPLPLCRCSWSSSFYRFTVLPFYRCACSTWPWSTLLFRYSTTPSLFYTEQPCFAGYKISFSLPLQLVCFVTTVLFRYRLSFLLQLVCFISTFFPWWQVPFFLLQRFLFQYSTTFPCLYAFRCLYSILPGVKGSNGLSSEVGKTNNYPIASHIKEYPSSIDNNFTITSTKPPCRARICNCHIWLP